MNEIIYLEPDEEITSIIDKLKDLEPTSKGVSLVIPKGSAILQSVVNLKLLKKQGEHLAKDVVVVTQDKIGRNLASQAGFSVYDKIDAKKPMIEPPKPEPSADEVIELDLTGKKEKEDKAPSGIAVNRYDDSGVPQPTPKPEPEISTPPPVIKDQSSSYFDMEKTAVKDTPAPASKPEPAPVNRAMPKAPKPKIPMSKKKKIVIGISIFAVIAGAVLFYMFYPKATITLTVPNDPFEGNVEVIADNNIYVVDESKLSIPGELIESEKEEAKTFPATGKKEVGDKAKGTVTLYNDSGQTESVSAGTEVSSQGLSYKTNSAVSVPGATASVDAGGNVVKTSGKVDVGVEATLAGDKYNLGPSTFSISGHGMLEGKNSSPISGGSSKQITIVSQNDLNSAKSELEKEIASTLHEDIKTKAESKMLFDSSIKDETISFEANKKVDEEASEFEMKVKVKSLTIAFNEQEFRQMVVKALEKNIPEGKTLSLSENDEVSTSSSELDNSKGTLKINGTVKTKLIPKIDINNLTKSIKGKSSSEVERIIKDLIEIESVTTVLNPSWLIKKVPSLNNNVEIKFEYK